jgi:hypothetical protein
VRAHDAALAAALDAAVREYRAEELLAALEAAP